MNITGKRVLITGGSSGIGLALAQVLLAKGAKVAISGRARKSSPKPFDPANRERRNPRHCSRCRNGRGPRRDARTSTCCPRRPRHPRQQRRRRQGRPSGEHPGSRASGHDRRQSCRADPPHESRPPGAAPERRRDGGEHRFGHCPHRRAVLRDLRCRKGRCRQLRRVLRRELRGEGVHVLTAYPGGTDTPMMKSNRAGAELGFSREPASAVADAIAGGIETGAIEVIRGGEARTQMVALNRENPSALDDRFLGLKPALEEAVKDHSAL